MLHPITSITPPKILKMFVTGNGNSGKDLMIREVFKRWNFDTNNNDVADAFGLAKMAYSFDHIEDLTKKQKESLKKVNLIIEHAKVKHEKTKS